MQWIGFSKQVLSTLTLAGIAGGAYGCGGGNSSTLRIETEASPLLLVHRDDGEASWTQVAVAGKTEFELEVDDRHEVVIVCQQTRGLPHVLTTKYARTTEDGDGLTGLCVNRPFVVSGTLVQPGQVSFAGAVSATSGMSRTFEFASKRGTFDLLMLGGDDFTAETFGARRGIMVDGDLNLGTIDLAQENLQPTVSKAFEISNLRAEEDPSMAPRLVNGEIEYLFFGTSGDTMARLPPASALSASERLMVRLSASISAPAQDLPSTARSITVSAEQAGAVALPEPLVAPAFEHQAPRSVATWSALPEYDELRFMRSTTAADQIRKAHELRMTHNYAVETDTAQLELDFREIPGFLPEWELVTGARPAFFLAANKGPQLQEGSATSTATRAVATADPVRQNEPPEDFFTDGYTWSD
jgi:hypothetical protein